MSVAPTGILSVPLERLRGMVASSSAFQAWTGTTSATAAKARVHVVNVDDTDLVRPLAVVDWGDKLRWQQRSPDLHEPVGECTLYFEADVSPDEAGYQDAAYAFMNQVGAVLAEVFALSGQSGWLNLLETEMRGAPARPLKSQAVALGDFYAATFVVTWGY